jgi:hypothetical protein
MAQLFVYVSAGFRIVWAAVVTLVAYAPRASQP